MSLTFKTYSCRKQGTEDWTPVRAYSGLNAAELFAQDEAMGDDSVVEVKGIGKFQVSVETRTVTEWNAVKVR